MARQHLPRRRRRARLHVLVHASKTAEPFGQVVLEGLAAGADDKAPAGYQKQVDDYFKAIAGKKKP